MTIAGEVLEEPANGRGGRAFDCDRYSDCLDFAACMDWESFHCEGCRYSGRGKLEFFLNEFEFVLTDEVFLELWDALGEDTDGEHLDTDF